MPELNDEDRLRILAAFGGVSYSKDAFNMLLAQTHEALAREFIVFLVDVFERMDIFQHKGLHQPTHAISKELFQSDIDNALRQIWNYQAQYWGVIESPGNYLATMQTYATYLRPNPTRKKENFVSLGAGPGLYETFLALHFARNGCQSVRFITIDYANKMTEIARRIARTVHAPRITQATASMTELPLPDGMTDHVICNNALQWVTDWKRGLAEMGRIAKQAGTLHIIVNTHPMIVRAADGSEMLRLGDFAPPDLFDEIERAGFELQSLRSIVGRPGVGQHGNSLSRIYVNGIKKARPFRNWRASSIRLWQAFPMKL